MTKVIMFDSSQFDDLDDFMYEVHKFTKDVDIIDIKYNISEQVHFIIITY